MERFCHQPPSAFRDLACPFANADPCILTCFSGALANILRRTHWMQGDQIASSFANAFGGLACALARAFAKVAGAASNIAAGASALGCRCRSGLRRDRLG